MALATAPVRSAPVRSARRPSAATQERLGKSVRAHRQRVTGAAEDRTSKQIAGLYFGSIEAQLKRAFVGIRDKTQWAGEALGTKDVQFDPVTGEPIEVAGGSGVVGGFFENVVSGVTGDLVRLFVEPDDFDVTKAVDWDAAEKVLSRIVGRNAVAIDNEVGQMVIDLLRAEGTGLGDAAAPAAAVSGVSGAVVADFGLGGGLDVQTLNDMGERVVGINAESRNRLFRTASRGLAEGWSPFQLAKELIGQVGGWRGKDGTITHSRAMVIARTETGIVYNRSSVLRSAQTGLVDSMICLDNPDCGWIGHDSGDKRNGKAVTFEDALAHPLSHPNCVRAYAPNVEGLGVPEPVSTAEPVVLDPEAAAADAARKAYADWENGLSPELRNALDIYQTPVSDALQAYLIDNQANPSWMVEQALRDYEALVRAVGFNKQAGGLVQNIRDAIKSSPGLPERTVVWRGTGRKPTAGETFTEKAFTSTSLRRDIAEDFALRASEPGQPGYVYRYVLPAGHKGAYLRSGGIDEFLLDANTEWVVVDVTDGIATVVPKAEFQRLGAAAGQLAVAEPPVPDVIPDPKRIAELYESKLDAIAEGKLDEFIITRDGRFLATNAGGSNITEADYRGAWVVRKKPAKRDIVLLAKDAERGVSVVDEVGPRDIRGGHFVTRITFDEALLLDATAIGVEGGKLTNRLLAANVIKPEGLNDYFATQFGEDLFEHLRKAGYFDAITDNVANLGVPPAYLITAPPVRGDVELEQFVQQHIDDINRYLQGKGPLPPGMDRQSRDLRDFQKRDYERLAADQGLTVEQLFAKVEGILQQTIDGLPLATRRSWSSAGNIIAQGRFKSQYEVQSSGGFYGPDTRAKAEADMFGYPRKVADLDPTKTPIYGYFDDSSATGKGYDTASSYGEVRFILNDAVRLRTTANWGDSLFDSATPSPATAVRAGSWSGRYMPKPGQTGSPYLEAQIHGGLSIDDVAEIHFTFQPPSDSMKVILQQRGFAEQPGGAQIWVRAELAGDVARARERAEQAVRAYERSVAEADAVLADSQRRYEELVADLAAAEPGSGMALGLESRLEGARKRLERDRIEANTRKRALEEARAALAALPGSAASADAALRRNLEEQIRSASDRLDIAEADEQRHKESAERSRKLGDDPRSAEALAEEARARQAAAKKDMDEAAAKLRELDRAAAEVELLAASTDAEVAAAAKKIAETYTSVEEIRSSGPRTATSTGVDARLAVERALAERVRELESPRDKAVRQVNEELEKRKAAVLKRDEALEEFDLSEAAYDEAVNEGTHEELVAAAKARDDARRARDEAIKLVTEADAAVVAAAKPFIELATPDELRGLIASPVTIKVLKDAYRARLRELGVLTPDELREDVRLAEEELAAAEAEVRASSGSGTPPGDPKLTAALERRLVAEEQRLAARIALRAATPLPAKPTKLEKAVRNAEELRDAYQGEQLKQQRLSERIRARVAAHESASDLILQRIESEKAADKLRGRLKTAAKNVAKTYDDLAEVQFELSLLQTKTAGGKGDGFDYLQVDAFRDRINELRRARPFAERVAANEQIKLVGMDLATADDKRAATSRAKLARDEAVKLGVPIEEALPGSHVRWSGEIHVESSTDTSFAAYTHFTGDYIAYHEDTITRWRVGRYTPEDMRKITLHEMLHTTSDYEIGKPGGGRGAGYGTAPGWEEGVVELMTGELEKKFFPGERRGYSTYTEYTRPLEYLFSRSAVGDETLFDWLEMLLKVNVTKREKIITDRLKRKGLPLDGEIGRSLAALKAARKSGKTA